MFRLVGFTFDAVNKMELDRKKNKLVELLRGHREVFYNEKTIRKCLLYVFDIPNLSDDERLLLAQKNNTTVKDLEISWEIEGSNLYSDMFFYPDIVHFLIPDKQKAIEVHTWALKSLQADDEEIKASIKSLLELYADEERSREGSKLTAYKSLVWIIIIVLGFIVALAILSSTP